MTSTFAQVQRAALNRSAPSHSLGSGCDYDGTLECLEAARSSTLAAITLRIVPGHRPWEGRSESIDLPEFEAPTFTSAELLALVTAALASR